MSNTSTNVKKDTNSALSKRLFFFFLFGKNFERAAFLFLFWLDLLKEPPKVTTVIATKGKGDDETEEISYTDAKVIGNGSFGVVYQARLISTNELVAIKKVLQDRRYKVGFFCYFLKSWSIFFFRRGNLWWKKKKN